MFIKDRPMSSFLGASFSSFGCFVLRSSFSSGDKNRDDFHCMEMRSRDENAVFFRG